MGADKSCIPDASKKNDFSSVIQTGDTSIFSSERFNDVLFEEDLLMVKGTSNNAQKHVVQSWPLSKGRDTHHK